jgi:hypothetical protein
MKGKIGVFLAGAILVALILVAMGRPGAAQVGSPADIFAKRNISLTATIPFNSTNPISLEDPKTGTPYTVPPGKDFVIVDFIAKGSVGGTIRYFWTMKGNPADNKPRAGFMFHEGALEYQEYLLGSGVAFTSGEKPLVQGPGSPYVMLEVFVHGYEIGRYW